jgi:hypothetical protein
LDRVDVSGHCRELSLELLLNVQSCAWLHSKQEGAFDAGTSEDNVRAGQRRDGYGVDNVYTVDAGLRERRGHDVPRRIPRTQATVEIASCGAGQPVKDGRLVEPQLDNPPSHSDEHTVR